MIDSVAIVGSCVSRDPFDVDPQERPEILLYAARTSFASAFSSEPFPLSLSELDPDQVMTSQWQQRMVEQDLSKTLPSQLKALPKYTPVIVDFIDERFRLLSLDGKLATYSADLGRTKCHTRIPGMNLLDIEDADRAARWTEGALALLSICEDRALPILINNCSFAVEDIAGNPVGDVASSEKMNQLMRGMCQFFADRGARLIFEPDYNFVAASTHKWGIAPFHYTDDIYRDFNRRLSAVVGQLQHHGRPQ